MRTSSPRRWIWIRIPSSFHSTEERSKPDIASATLGAGRGEHRQDRPEDLEPDARGARPRPRSSRSAPSASDRPTASAPAARARRGTPAALATASAISPASAPCRSSPVSSRRRNVGLRPRWRGRAGRRAARRARPPIRARWRLDLVDRPVDVVDRERAARRGLGLDAVDRRVADADAALTRHAGQEADADRDLVRRRAAAAARRGSRPCASASSSRRRASRPRPHRRAASCPEVYQLVHRPFDLGRSFMRNSRYAAPMSHTLSHMDLYDIPQDLLEFRDLGTPARPGADRAPRRRDRPRRRIPVGRPPAARRARRARAAVRARARRHGHRAR